MASIYPDYDGVVYKIVTDTWANTRNASSGTLDVTSSHYIQNSHTGGRGGDTFHIGRYFLEFDTSSINKTISSASVQLYGISTGTLDVILMKGSQSGAVATTDFNEVYGASTPFANTDGIGGGRLVDTDAVDYSSEITTWSTSGYNEITLSDDAKADIIANDTFNCVLMGYDYDFLDAAPDEEWYRVGFYQDSHANPFLHPRLEVTEQDDAVFFGANF